MHAPLPFCLPALMAYSSYPPCIDPWLSSAVVVTVTSTEKDYNTMSIIGADTTTFNFTNGVFAFNGLSLRGEVGAHYTFILKLTSSLLGGDQVRSLCGLPLDANFLLFSAPRFSDHPPHHPFPRRRCILRSRPSTRLSSSRIASTESTTSSTRQHVISEWYRGVDRRCATQL